MRRILRNFAFVFNSVIIICSAFAQGSGNAIDFDGSNDKVVISGLSHSNNATVMAWIMYRSSPNGPDSNHGIIHLHPPGSVNGPETKTIAIWVHGSGKIGGRIIQSDGAQRELPLNQSLSKNQWYHVALTINQNSGKVFQYVNGINVGNVDYNGTLQSWNEGMIGRQEPETWDGQIDEVSIWNRALTETEIRSYICKELKGNETGLIGYWRVDESSGTTVFDATSNGRHGTMINMDSASDHVRSGAPIGDASIYQYSSPINLSLSHSDGDKLTVDAVAGNPLGLHIYRVDEAPNITSPPAGFAIIDRLRYWGVFLIGGTNPTYQITYNYNGHQSIIDESALRMAKRANNAATFWSDLGASLDINGNTLTKTGENYGEYILGSSIKQPFGDLPPVTSQRFFENITNSSGIQGMGITHSVLFCDYNNDGLPDLYVIHAAGNTELYRNNGNRTFTLVTGITLLPSGQYLFVGIMGDYDNDGDLDLFVGSDDSNFDGQIPCILFQNEGNGNFTDVSVASGIASIATRVFSATWLDFDNDGNLDLFLGTVQKPNNIFLRNLGNKTFVNLSSSVNLSGLFTDTRGIATGDFDRDGDIDIFVPNTGATRNYLFRNDGNVFSEIAASLGVDFPSDDSHSAEFADYDNDGDLDLLVGNTANGGSLRLLKNEKGAFAEVTANSGLNPVYTYGSSFNDFDNDGYLDLLVVQGGPPQRRIAFYRNDGNGRFIDATSISGLDTLTTRHTLAVADLDNDGKLDVNIGAYTSDGKDQLYRNITVARNWLKIKLNGTSSNKVGIGAWLELTANSKKQYRQITAGKGYRSQDDLTQHFGLGDATIVNSLKIEWPSGIVQILTNISANQTLTVTESRRLPTAPQNLRATAGDKQITLSWNANTEADFLRYRIYGGTTPNPTTKIDSVDGVANTTKTLTGLSNGTKYYFRITAVDQNLNQSGFSNEVSATPTLIDLSPAPPKNLTATAGDKQITLKWDANSELDLLRYRIYGGIAPNPTTAIDSVLAVLGTTKIITGLNNGIKYYFRLTAVDLTLNVSGYSNEVSATPTTGPVAPNAPTNLAATPVSSTQINLTWSDNSSNETSFEIERKAGAGGTYAVIATRPGDASTGADNYSNTGLSPNTAYFYRVRAVLNTVTPILYSNYSNETNPTTFPAIPAAPSNLVASAISNSQIRLSWNATSVTGEEGFRIYRSTSAGVAIVAGNLVGSVGINIETFTDTGLSSSATYYYKVVAFNISGNSSPSNEASATPAGDKTPPTLSAVSYAQKVNLNTDAAISLSITDLSGIKNATLYYRSGGAASFSSRAMTLQSGSTYTQTIPAAAVTNRGVEFYVAAEDNFNNLSQSPSYPIQVYCPNGIANPNAQPSGKDAGAYRIFSIPLDLDNKTPAAFLNANSSLGAYDDTKYRWYGLERSTQTLREYPNFGSIMMAPDMGFALLVSLQNLKLKTGSGTTVVTTKPYSIALPAGWSLIGNPFNYNIPFDSLRVSADTFELWSFEGDWQINTAGLEPWKGYAIWLSQAATFSIRPGLAGLKSATSFYSVENNEAENWLIQITAENGRSTQTGSASRFNFVGQNEMAKDDEDQFDLHQPLRLADGVELIFNQQFTTDIRQSSANGHTWELTCMLNPADEILSLAFEGIHSVPPSFEIFLIDRETQTAYDLRRNQRLQFATRHLTEKRFQLMAGTKTYLDSQTSEAELHPANYVLLQNFPNPFNPTTQIIYSLPEASHVEVSVYNLRGERVATLVNEQQEMGSHTVVWNAEKVGSGVYLIRIRAGRFESLKKCLFVK